MQNSSTLVETCTLLLVLDFCCGSDIKSKKKKIKSSLYSRYYAKAYNKWRGPSLRLSTWATQLRRNITTVASHWRHCADLTVPGIETQTSVPSKLCACARAHGFQRLHTRVNILHTDTQYHDEAMFLVGKLRKIAPEPAKRTHFFAKCTVQWLRVIGARGGGGRCPPNFL